MKVSDHFDIREFVPKVIYNKYGTKSIWFIDPRLIEGMELIRTFFNAQVTINNWHIGGNLQNRGFRMPDSKVGASLSQHKFGRAADFNVKGLASDEVYDQLLDNWKDFAPIFTTMENKDFTRGWTHIDLRHTNQDDVLIVNP